ncbi:MAG: alpha/beta hydrolase [Alistipes indistinctus]
MEQILSFLTMFYKNPHFPKTIFLILCLVLCNTVSKAQHAPFEVTLWPSTPPGNSGLTGPETIDEHGFVHNVTLPSLLVYPAAQEKNTGMAVLIAPGGGYSFLAINHEGKEIAQWLAGNGITGVVLKYRIPNGHHAIPLADAQQGMRLIRENSAKWKIDPNSVGVMGSSAGGHLASTLLTHFDAATRPDFGVLFLSGNYLCRQPDTPRIGPGIGRRKPHVATPELLFQ